MEEERGGEGTNPRSLNCGRQSGTHDSDFANAGDDLTKLITSSKSVVVVVVMQQTI